MSTDIWTDKLASDFVEVLMSHQKHVFHLSFRTCGAIASQAKEVRHLGALHLLLLHLEVLHCHLEVHGLG